MENSRLKTRILMEIEKMIMSDNPQGKMTKEVKEFHEAIIKNYYNAIDVKIDYHRHRVKMNIVIDDSMYDPKIVNNELSVLPTNMYFISLTAFLKSCIEHDRKSLAFYVKILKDFTEKDFAKAIA